jgi:hypothetical protein
MNWKKCRRKLLWLSEDTRIKLQIKIMSLTGFQTMQINDMSMLTKWNKIASDNVGFEVLLVLTVKITVFWDVTMSTWETTQHLRGTYCFHLQG